MSNKDYYAILGVSKSASDDELKRAFRKLALEHHPDRGGNAEKFKEINEAYQVLGDPKKRQVYDQYGSEVANQGFQGGASGFGGFGQNVNVDLNDLGDMFGEMFGFGGGRKKKKSHGADIEMDLRLTFEESVFGAEKEIELYKNEVCETCGGTGGEKGKKEIDCFACGGRGQRVAETRTMFGTFQSVTDCEPCQGRGKKPEKPCPDCKGAGIKKARKIIKVKVPSGVEEGETLRVIGEGEVAPLAQGSGDLYFHLRVSANKVFDRRGLDIYTSEEISFADAVLGGTKIVRTLYGETEIAIPAGTVSGQLFRLKNKGVERGKPKGDQLVEVKIIVPKHPTKRQKELLKEWKEI